VKRVHIVPRLIGIVALVVATVFAIHQWVYAESVDRIAWDALYAATGYEAPKSTKAITESKQKLQKITAAMSGTYGSNVGVVVTDLSNDASASTNADTQFVSASIYKLFVAYDIYKKIDAGTLSSTEKLTAYGTSRTVEQCLSDMITVSDNTCGKALGALDDWAALDAMLASEGYSHTMLNNYNAAGVLTGDKQTSASDVALLLSRLYKGTLLSKTSSEHFIHLLKGDTINYMLPSGLPSGTVIAHKVGFLGQYQHDAGIVYGTKKNMLVVMLTKGWTTSPETQATAAFTTLGQAVWDYMEGS
jgi:beta-lactamase class A